MKTYSLLIKILFICFIYFSCSSAPRYRTGNTASPKTTPPRSYNPTKKEKKNNSSSNKTVFIGKASFYGPKFHGKKTANGEIFDMYKFTAAHKTLLFDTKLRVTNLSNGKSVIVRINDRGPFVAGRILDLSYGSAQKIGMVEQGVTDVKIEIVERGKK